MSIIYLHIPITLDVEVNSKEMMQGNDAQKSLDLSNGVKGKKSLLICCLVREWKHCQNVESMSRVNNRLTYSPIVIL